MALKFRLQHQLAMLRAVGISRERWYAERALWVGFWKECDKLSEAMVITHHLGTPVEAAFSTYVQRKLATTVPPRPKVDMKFDVAITNVKQMCTDCVDMVKVGVYTSPGSILVRMHPKP